MGEVAYQALTAAAAKKDVALLQQAYEALAKAPSAPSQTVDSLAAHVACAEVAVKARATCCYPPPPARRPAAPEAGWQAAAWRRRRPRRRPGRATRPPAAR
jgi:hypothetical protein